MCGWRHQLVCWQTAVLLVTLYLVLRAYCRAGYVGPHMRTCSTLSRSVPAATLRNFGRWYSRMTLMAGSGTGQVAMFMIDWETDTSIGTHFSVKRLFGSHNLRNTNNKNMIYRQELGADVFKVRKIQTFRTAELRVTSQYRDSEEGHLVR